METVKTITPITPLAPEEIEKVSASVQTRKLHRTATIIKDKALLATLANDLITKGLDGVEAKNGFWALCSVEKMDSVGDIIVVDGIESELDAANGRYLPLLPSHLMRMPDGSAAEIGRIEALVKTMVDGVPALAMYFTFALDEAGEPIDDLVRGYYKRYTLGYSNTFSVGMEALGEPEPIRNAGFKFGRTKLYEVSCVAVPANSGAIGLTRAKEDIDLINTLVAKIDTLTEVITKMQGNVDNINIAIDGSFVKAFKPLEDRLDMLESSIVAKQAKVKVKAPEVKAETVDTEAIKAMLEAVVKKYQK
jgi:hypothetical protein